MNHASELERLREAVDAQGQRITELEIEAAFLRRTNEELDEVVREQAERVDRLERRLAELVGALASAED